MQEVVPKPLNLTRVRETSQPVIDGPHRVCYTAETWSAGELCPHCGNAMISRGYTDRVTIHDTIDENTGKPRRISLRRQKWRCRNCGYCLQIRSPDIHPDHRITYRCLRAAAKEHLRGDSNTAGRYDLSKSVVFNLASDVNTWLSPALLPTASLAMSFDAIDLRRHLATTMVTLPDEVGSDESSRMVEFILEYSRPTKKEREDREKATVGQETMFAMGDSNRKDKLRRKKYDAVMTALMSLMHPERIKYFVVDFDLFELKVIQDFCKARGISVTIIIDVRHVLERVRGPMVTRINRLLDKGLVVRDASGKRVNKRKILALVNERPHKLVKKEDRDLLKHIRNNYDGIRSPYDVKESFYRLFISNEGRTKSAFSPERRAEAEVKYAEWKNSIPPELRPVFQPAINNFTRRYDHIFSYFEFGYTAGATEARQGWIRNLYNQGRGYSFPMLRAKVMTKYGAWPAEWVERAIEAVLAGKPPLDRPKAQLVSVEGLLSTPVPQLPVSGFGLFAEECAA